MKRKWSQFKADIAMIIRGYQLLSEIGQGASVAYKAAAAVLRALLPLVNLFFSGRLIDQLAGDRDPSQLLWLAAGAAVSNLILTLAANLCQRRIDALDSVRWSDVSMLYSKKMLSMDYEDVEDTRVHEALDHMLQVQMWQGWGLNKLPFVVDDIVGGLVGMVVSLGITVGLFTAPVQEAPGLAGVLASHWGMLLLIGMMVLSIFVFKRTSAIFAKGIDDLAEDMTLANRLHFYFHLTLSSDHKQGKDIRLYGEGPLATQVMGEVADLILGCVRRVMKPFTVLEGIRAGMPYLVSAMVYLVVASKAWCGAVGLGSVVLYAGTASQFAVNFQKLVDRLTELWGNNLHLRNFFDFIDRPNRKYMGAIPTEKRNDNDYLIEFRDVSFRYPGAETWALRHVSLTLRIGERLAVVGRNGSGKTTMIKLLCRLYDPTEGSITLNGIDIKKYNYDEYLALFSVVFQDFHLFSFELGQSVAASVDYDEGEVRRVLKEAGLEERLKTMPQGLHTYLNKDFDDKGVEFSGGEAQKAAIARALYKAAPFLVLDEPTAALDPMAEYEVYRRFGDIAGEKTAVCISHRLSSCRFCDRIAVFEKGRLVQIGSHDGLLQDVGGAYQRLWDAQAKYYAEDEELRKLLV